MVEGLLQHQFVRKSNLGLNLYWSIPYKSKGPPQNCLRLGDRAKCCQKLNPSLLKYQKWKSPLKIKSQNQKLTKIKVENPESPLSKSLILERRLCLALAGLSLQKSKLHWLAVAEGLKTLEVLYYLSVVAVSLYKSIGLLWVVSRWSIIAEKIRQNAACLINSNFILSKSRNLEQKISIQKSVGFAGFGYTVQFRLLD